jgi:hypothetical protein
MDFFLLLKGLFGSDNCVVFGDNAQKWSFLMANLNLLKPTVVLHPAHTKGVTKKNIKS